MAMKDIRGYYGLPVKRGMTVRHKSGGWTGAITSSKNGMLRVKTLSSNMVLPFHPHEIDYLSDDGWLITDDKRQKFEAAWENQWAALLERDEYSAMLDLGGRLVPDWNLMGGKYEIDSSPNAVNVKTIFLPMESDDQYIGIARNVCYRPTMNETGCFFADIEVLQPNAVTFIHELAHVADFVCDFLSKQDKPDALNNDFVSFGGAFFKRRAQSDEQSHGNGFLSAYYDLASKAEGFLPLHVVDELWSDYDRYQ